MLTVVTVTMISTIKLNDASCLLENTSAEKASDVGMIIGIVVAAIVVVIVLVIVIVFIRRRKGGEGR